jgi:hypothetical protein
VTSFSLSDYSIAQSPGFVNRFLKEFLNSFVTEELEAIIPTEQPVVTASLISLGKQGIEVFRPEHQTGETATHEGERVHHRENILS